MTDESKPKQPDPPAGQKPDRNAPDEIDPVDEASMESFPGSDPPTYTGATAARGHEPNDQEQSEKK